MLTHQEHTARAMLLGRVYDWRDGTYCALGVLGGPSEDDMLDCLTLEPILVNSKLHDQRRAQGHMEKYNWREPTEPTPWAKLG